MERERERVVGTTDAYILFLALDKGQRRREAENVVEAGESRERKRW